jgi:hypothetical protein
VTHPAVQHVLDLIEAEWPDTAGSFDRVPLERIDRDNSTLVSDDGHDERIRSAELQTTNYVSATFADRSTTPIGTEYDHDLEVVVGVRIEGLHADEHGHVDPDADLTGGSPVPWAELVDAVRRAILAGREFPDTGAANVGYTDLRVTNEAPDAAAYGDYYRTDFDVVFNGFESLP